MDGMDKAIKCHRRHRYWISIITMAATVHVVILRRGKTAVTFSHICAWGMTSDCTYSGAILTTMALFQTIVFPFLTLEIYILSHLLVLCRYNLQSVEHERTRDISANPLSLNVLESSDDSSSHTPWERLRQPEQDASECRGPHAWTLSISRSTSQIIISISCWWGVAIHLNKIFWI